ncbi:MAG: glycosyltransferase family 2 protein [Chloroflexota bacterium]
MPADLSVIVVSYNTHDLLAACLRSVLGTANGLDCEVVIVDNGSTDGSELMVARKFPQAKLIRNRSNQGFARANNQAFELSSGRHVLLLNSDAALLDGAAQALVTFLDAHPEAAAAGGKVLNPDGTFQSSYADFPGLWGETLLLTGLSRRLLPRTYPSYPESQSLEQRRVDWVSGAFIALRRRALADVGLLDEDYFMYTEEVDWCYRARRRGWSICYLPEAQAIHWSGASARRVPERKRAQLYQSKWLFMRKHRDAGRALAYWLLVRGISGMKLVAWRLSRILSANPEARERARQNVVSYQYLLSNLSGWRA